MGIYGSSESVGQSNVSNMYKFKPFVFFECMAKPSKGYKPKPRSGHRVVCCNNNLYSYGGYNPSIDDKDPEMKGDWDWLESKPLFKEVWKYNFALSQWTKLPIKDIPLVLASNAVVLSGSIFMVYGGTGVPFGGHCSNSLYICDLGDEDLAFKIVDASGPKPEPQYGQAIMLKGHHLYVIGGTTGYEYSADVHRLDLNSGTWEQVYMCTGSFEEPEGRYRHELGFDGRRIYVLGGGTAELAFGFEELPAFDTHTETWTKVATLSDPEAGYPAARRFHSSCQLPGSDRVVIVGGYNGVDILADTWRLDLRSLRWEHLPDTRLPLPTYFHSSAITPAGKLYSFGGINQRSKRTERTERTGAVHSTWLCIPKLKEIAWEAVVHYGLINDKTPAQLRHSGYPMEFVKRLCLYPTD